MGYAKLCEHGHHLYHYTEPPDTKKGTYLQAHQYIRCEGGKLFEIDWPAAYAAGEWMGDGGASPWEKSVEAIVAAALGETP
jgi:hypothetical protein